MTTRRGRVRRRLAAAARDRRVRGVQGVRPRARARRRTGATRGRIRSGRACRSIQGWYALGSGGIGGTGLGLGHPGIIPDAATDFIFSAIGEELGLVGTIGVVAAFMLLVGSAYRIAIDAARPFAKLFAAGIATIIGLQTFLIIGGVLRVIPLTGITLPFVSYGGSSLVANFALLAILLRISDDNARAQGAAVNTGIRRVGIVMIVLFVGLVAQLTYLQVGASEQPRQRPAQRARSSCATSSATAVRSSAADGVILAEVRSVQRRVQVPARVSRGDRAAVRARRRLPVDPVRLGRRREHVLRRSRRPHVQAAVGNLADRFATTQPVGTVVLTLADAVQQVAADALAGPAGQRRRARRADRRRRSRCTRTPRSTRTCSRSHNTRRRRRTRAVLLEDPGNPLLAARVARDLPAGLDVQDGDRVDRAPEQRRRRQASSRSSREIPLPQTTATLHNFGGERCGGTLEEGFIVSCNTTFGQVGLDLGNTFAIGHPELRRADRRRRHVRSSIRRSSRAPARSPGTFALEPAGVRAGRDRPADRRRDAARDGAGRGRRSRPAASIYEPHVVDCVKDPQDRIVERSSDRRILSARWIRRPPTRWRRSCSASSTTRAAPARAAQIPGVQVAGKTGTAETAPGEPPHAWFIAFAPADHPRYAVAVLVEHGGTDGVRTRRRPADASRRRSRSKCCKLLLAAAGNAVAVRLATSSTNGR